MERFRCGELPHLHAQNKLTTLIGKRQRSLQIWTHPERDRGRERERDPDRERDFERDFERERPGGERERGLELDTLLLASPFSLLSFFVLSGPALARLGDAERDRDAALLRGGEREGDRDLFEAGDLERERERA